MAKKDELTISLTETEAGLIQDHKAMELATAIDIDAGPVVTHLAEIKAEYQGGPFAVLYNVIDRMTDEQRDDLPKPRTTSGNNPAWFKLKSLTKGAKPKVKVDLVYYYDRVALQLPTVKAKALRKMHLERSLDAEANHDDIPNDIMNLPQIIREGEIKKIGTAINTAKDAVCRGFELYFQIKAAHAYRGTKIQYTLARDSETGAVLDGKDGRAFRVDGTVAAPIKLITKDEGREDTDFAKLGIGSFLNLNFDVATEKGGTYSSLMATLPKKGGGEPEPVATGVTIKTVDKFITVMNDVTEYLFRTVQSTDKAALDLIQKTFDKTDEDGDLFMYNACYVFDFLESLGIKSDRNQVRYQALCQKFGDVNVLADHIAKMKAKQQARVAGK